MKLPSTQTVRYITINDLLAAASFEPSENQHFFTSLADYGQCSWGDNFATLVTAEFLNEFIDDVRGDLLDEISEENLTTLENLLTKMEAKNLPVNLMS